MLQDFLQRLLGGGAPVQPMPNRLGLAPDMLEGPGAAGPGMLAYHNALSSMSAPAQQAQPFTLDAQGFPSAPAPYAAQQAQPAPMQPQQPLSRSGVSEAPSGGGIGSFLGNIFSPGAAGRNQTVQWLQSQGMDEGMATLMAGNKGALQNYLLDRTKGADPKAALELAKLQLEVGNLANPQMSPAEAERLRLEREKFGFDQQQAGVTTDIKNYQFYADAERAAGREPLGPLEWEKAQRASGATNINNNVGNGEVGTIPQGYELITSPEGARSMRPIPGGPAEAELNYQTAIDTADQSLANIDAVINDPNLDMAIGVGGVLPPIPGTPQAGVVARIEQLQGTAFLQAFESLKGGGQITEVEGHKATQAIARLNRAQRREDFVTALQDLREIVSRARNRAALKLGGGSSSTGGQPGGVVDYRDWLGSE